jgi:hypothetical protein
MKTIKITTHLPVIPGWIKINNTMTIPLPMKSAKELAAKLLEVTEDIEIELTFATGKEPSLEIKFENKTDQR